MRSRVGWCCQTALPQHIHCTFFETPSISLREISFVIINWIRAGACLLLTEKPPQPVRVQRLELRSLKFRRSIHVCLRTPAALHDHKSCGSKRPHLPHPRLHARIPASPQAYRCGAAAPRAVTAHTCAPRAPRTYTYAPCCICGPSIMSVFYHRLFPRSYPWHQYEIGIYLPAPAKQTHFVLFQFTFYHTIAAR